MKITPAFRTFARRVFAGSLVLCGLQTTTPMFTQAALADGNSELDAMLDAGSPPAKKSKPSKRESEPTAPAGTSAPAAEPPANSTAGTSSSSATSAATDNAASSAPASYSDSSSNMDGASGSNAISPPDPSSDASTASGQGFSGAYNEAPESNNLGAAELNNNGVEAILKKDYAQAVQILEQAVKADPNYRKAKENLRAATYNMGMQIYDRHEYGKALPVLQRAAALTQELGGAAESDLTAIIQYCQRHAGDH